MMILINENRTILIFYIAAFFVMAFGITIGGIFYANRYAQSGEIISYMNQFFKNTSNSPDKYGIMMHSVKLNAVTAVVLFVSSFFRFGCIIAAAEILRRGFIIGFTVTSVIYIYKIKGLIYAAASIPSLTVIIPAIALFSAINSVFSLKKYFLSKKTLFLYILFSIAVFSIFCISSFFDGYVTTIFIQKT